MRVRDTVAKMRTAVPHALTLKTQRVNTVERASRYIVLRTFRVTVGPYKD